jgi:hypothetical protein
MLAVSGLMVRKRTTRLLKVQQILAKANQVTVKSEILTGFPTVIPLHSTLCQVHGSFFFLKDTFSHFNFILCNCNPKKEYKDKVHVGHCQRTTANSIQ